MKRSISAKYADAVLTAHNYNLPTLLTRNESQLYKLLEQHGFCWSEEKGTWLPKPGRNGLEPAKANRKEKVEEWLSFPVTVRCTFVQKGIGVTLDTKISRGILYFMAFRARVNRTFNCAAFMSVLYGWEEKEMSYTQAEFDQIMEQIKYGTHDYPDDITDAAIVAGLVDQDRTTIWAEGIYGHTELTSFWSDDRMIMKDTYPLPGPHHQEAMAKKKAKNSHRNGNSMAASSNGHEIALKSPLK